MKKSLILITFITTSLFANIDNIIISENYIPQKHCKTIKKIKVDDNKSATKQDIYKQLKIKAHNLKANVVLNIIYHNGIFNNYVSADASKCDLKYTTQLNSKVIQNNDITSKNKFPLSMYKYPMINQYLSTIGIEVGLTSSLNKTFFVGLSYSPKDYYELYGHIVYLHDNNSRDLGINLGVREYLFTNTKYENIRLTLDFGVQNFEYKNSVKTQDYGFNLGLGYVLNKNKGIGFDIFYKAINSTKNASITDHINLVLTYKF